MGSSQSSEQPTKKLPINLDKYERFKRLGNGKIKVYLHNRHDSKPIYNCDDVNCYHGAFDNRGSLKIY